MCQAETRLPAARRWRGAPTDLLICDDDRLQDRDRVSRFVAGRKLRPDHIICERGCNISDRFTSERTSPDLSLAELDRCGARKLSCRIKRLASMPLCRPPRNMYASAGYVGIFEGFLGPLVPADTFIERAFDVPGIVWTVDDVRLSGMAHANGLKVWASPSPRPEYFNGRFDRMAALHNQVEQGVDRFAADRFAAEQLRDVYRVWP